MARERNDIWENEMGAELNRVEWTREDQKGNTTVTSPCQDYHLVNLCHDERPGWCQNDTFKRQMDLYYGEFFNTCHCFIITSVVIRPSSRGFEIYSSVRKAREVDRIWIYTSRWILWFGYVFACLKFHVCLCWGTGSLCSPACSQTHQAILLLPPKC